MIRLQAPTGIRKSNARKMVEGAGGYPAGTRSKVYTDVSYPACAKKNCRRTPLRIYPQFATHANAHTILAAIYHLAGQNYYPSVRPVPARHGRTAV